MTPRWIAPDGHACCPSVLLAESILNRWKSTPGVRAQRPLAHGDEIRLGHAVVGYRLVMPRDTTIE
jgi:hypothetical protein